MFRMAIIVSIGVHAAGLAALAAWSIESVRSRVRFAGRERAIQLVMATEQRWTPELSSIELEADSPVVVGPLQALVAKRRYVQTSTNDELSPDSGHEVPHEISDPQLTRVPRDENIEPTWDVERPHEPPVVQRRAIAFPRRFSVGTLPSSLGNSDEVPPDLSRNAPPTYPALAIQRGWQGTVFLRLSIDEAGRITQLEVVRSSGYALLDAAAANAVRHWKARPAYRNDRPVPTVEVLPVQFKL